MPVDRARPQGRSLALAVVIRPADQPRRRIGPLLLNTGGGGSAIAQLRLALETGGVRGSLAERRVTFYGIHQTTLVGRTHAQRFGNRLRGLILDTALDDTASPVQRLASEVQGHEPGRDLGPDAGPGLPLRDDGAGDSGLRRTRGAGGASEPR